MKYKAEITILPHPQILDPQGKVVKQSLESLGLYFEDIRIGKHVQIIVSSENETEAKTKVEEACQKLLINPIVEFFEFSLQEIE